MRFIIVMLALLLAATCASETDSAVSQRGALTVLVEPETALSKELMLSLGQAKNYHHKADVLLSDGKLDEAADEVAKIMHVPFPEDAPESEDALLDTRARLAKMRMSQGKLAEAMILVDEGISEASRPSFFLANLHTVRGELFEAQAGAALPGSEASRHAKIEAIAAFDTSIQINAALLDSIATKE